MHILRGSGGRGCEGGIPGSENSKYKGPEMGIALVCMRNGTETGVAGAV